MKQFKNTFFYLFLISFNAFANDVANQDVDKNEIQEEEIEVLQSEDYWKSFLKKLAFPEKTKKIYLDDQTWQQEYYIIERLLFCLITKIEYLGHHAFNQVIPNVKTLHYIMNRQIVQDVSELPLEAVEIELIEFYELFTNHMERPFNEYEKNNIKQMAANQYFSELAQESLWKKICQMQDSTAFENKDDEFLRMDDIQDPENC